jgi:hypothetical protein
MVDLYYYAGRKKDNNNILRLHLSSLKFLVIRDFMDEVFFLTLEHGDILEVKIAFTSFENDTSL